MPTDKFERLDTGRIALILSVALEEFAWHRYQDASFNRIIRNCKMAKGTMYYYFKSKDDLFLMIYKATVREFGQLVRLAQRPLQQDFWTRSAELIDGLMAILQNKPTAGLFVTNFLNQSSRQENHPASATIGLIDAWIHDYLQQGQEIGAIRSDLSAAQLTAMAWGLWESFRPWIAGISDEKSQQLDPSQLLDIFERLFKPLDPLPLLAEFESQEDMQRIWQES